MLKPSYIVGLVDGEGSFTVHIPDPNSDKDVKRRARAEPRFYLKLIGKDKEILEKLKSYFDCGKVYIQRDKRNNREDCYRYEVANRHDLQEIIIPFFKKHKPKLKTKRKDFELFCEIMEGIEKDKHLSEKGLKELYEIKKKMH
ncbi:MAG: LAGLIDADG family homing endonuclease [Candidatus Paceibacterota bacterium]